MAIIFTNMSRDTCLVDGYPSFALLDANHRPMAANVDHGCGFFPNCPQPQPVALAPSGAASFDLEFIDNPQGEPPTPCASSTYAQLSPPDDPATIEISLNVAPCGQPSAPPDLYVSAIEPHAS